MTSACSLENTEAVREADRAVELVKVLVGELEPSHSPKVGDPRRRSTTTSRIVPRAQRTSFAVPLADLEVHASHDALPGTGVVVLHELLGNAEVGVHVAPIALVEEAPLVSVDHGLDQHGSLYPCVQSLHVASCLIVLRSGPVNGPTVPGLAFRAGRGEQESAFRPR